MYERIRGRCDDADDDPRERGRPPEILASVAVIAACAVLVAAGAVIVVRWGAEPRADDAEAGIAGWLRYGGAALAAGTVAGVLAAGAGGRLVMRLLALTSPDASGIFTEAGEQVGEITVSGTVGFIVFGGLAAGLLSGALYALLQPVLPPGRIGGVVLGGLLLLLAGTQIEPLRADNIDFEIVGPAWLAVLAFIALGLFHGMVVVAAGARLVRRPAKPVIGPRMLIAGRIAVAIVALAALPSFATSIADILG